MSINTKTSKVAIFCALALASVLGLCWYPLRLISETHLGGTQILFYAFASAALLTLPLLFRQANRWRPHTPVLVTFGLISASATTLLQYALLQGEPIVIVSIIGITLPSLLLFSQSQPLRVSSFIASIAVVFSAIMMMYLFSNGLMHHWTEWVAALVAVLFFGIFYFDRYSVVIPLGSKLSVSFIGSTWLVGMITIFSERFSSYMEDNAVNLSIIYGSLCLLPIMASLLYVLSSERQAYISLWLPLLLAMSCAGLFLNEAFAYSVELLWLTGLLSFSVALQLLSLLSKD